MVGERKCPYYTQELSVDAIAAQFSTLLHKKQSIIDIESLYEEGEKLHLCPYYASHSLLPTIEFIAVPYNFIIQPSVRKSLSLNLKDSILIFDEAHNIVDCVKGIFNQSISLIQITSLSSQTAIYFEKFKLRFKGSNQVNIQTIIVVLERLNVFCNQFQSPKTKIISVSEFFHLSNLEGVNVYELQRFIEIFGLDKKIQSYGNLDNKRKYRLTSIFTFLSSLTNDDSNGKLMLYFEGICEQRIPHPLR
ncbi:hypothetical protein DI09_43p250 [Mitosporidium daphniae]|uniref:Helicase ATP-binding domain-containing protein n=1 Tax=Mitosporidium daphniae TaxID=1485682 RepID=A0A098VQ83_9MICR|nr:uncharacterized protein DI09_43p250 [Mitosporidium daphniae]KGG51150.1 hypothetical protein DI09_43p250 [Mitosporidium daphniae]|eukprot:XP_013237577.1 uncharacterized protein DI09_43p250 [Mitosporidium daphniae]